MKLCGESTAVSLSAAAAQPGRDGAVPCHTGFCPCVRGKTASPAWPAGDAWFCRGTFGQSAPRGQLGTGPGVVV